MKLFRLTKSSNKEERYGLTDASCMKLPKNHNPCRPNYFIGQMLERGGICFCVSMENCRRMFIYWDMTPVKKEVNKIGTVNCIVLCGVWWRRVTGGIEGKAATLFLFFSVITLNFFPSNYGNIKEIDRHLKYFELLGATTRCTLTQHFLRAPLWIKYLPYREK